MTSKWEVETFETCLDGIGEATGVRVVSKDGEVICDNETYYPKELDPQYANLIAAAPELLEALKRCLANVDSYKLAKDVMAVIDKAEGREI